MPSEGRGRVGEVGNLREGPHAAAASAGPDLPSPLRRPGHATAGLSIVPSHWKGPGDPEAGAGLAEYVQGGYPPLRPRVPWRVPKTRHRGGSEQGACAHPEPGVRSSRGLQGHLVLCALATPGRRLPGGGASGRKSSSRSKQPFPRPSLSLAKGAPHLRQATRPQAAGGRHTREARLWGHWEGRPERTARDRREAAGSDGDRGWRTPPGHPGAGRALTWAESRRAARAR
jgi:hypothetical protein